MSRSSYDDWNLAGQSNERSLSGSIPFNSKANSALIVCCSFILLIIGLICVYSASFPDAMANNLPDYTFLLRQLIYVALGLVLGAIVLVLPQKALEAICPVFMLLCLIVFGANIYIKTPFLLTETSINIVFLANFMYLSLFFANRENGIRKLRELFLPILFTLVFLVAILIQKSFVYGILFVFVSIVMFACGSVGLGGVLLLIFYAIVPTACWILSDANNINKVLNLLVPGYFSSVSNVTVNAKAAIASGHLIGKGLGNGQFKYGIIPDISGDYIFCNLAEEFGFAGVALVFILFFIIIYCSFRAVRHLRYSNRFYSNFCCALTVIFTCCFLINISSVLGIIPVSGFSLPLFSAGESIITSIVEVALIYKMAKDSSADDYIVETQEFNPDSDFEVGYEPENS